MDNLYDDDDDYEDDDEGQVEYQANQPGDAAGNGTGDMERHAMSHNTNGVRSSGSSGILAGAEASAAAEVNHPISQRSPPLTAAFKLSHSLRGSCPLVLQW